MEEHRLKPMPENYDPKLFADIYKKTADLRRKLISQIDHTRFGVERQDLKSWFDTKFLFTFQKYYGEKPEILKAYIINSLLFFKNRVLRYSYSKKNFINLNRIDIEEAYQCKETFLEPETHERAELLDLAKKALKARLSKKAYLILELELNPPSYILNRLGKSNTTKIPNTLLGEYLGLEECKIKELKKEIQTTVGELRSNL